jgi:isoleucyl-tRNA synthetase
VLATTKGAALEHIEFRHPLYDRPSPVYLADYVGIDAGTGIVHSSPAHGVEDFSAWHAYGRSNEEILSLVMSGGQYVADLPLLRRHEHLEGEPGDRRQAQGASARCCRTHKIRATATCTAGATRRRSIYRARRRNGSSAWRRCPAADGVKPRRPARQRALRAIEAIRKFFPRLGPGAPARA